jgi:pimeloyl-ACP methyl ester carboxylesterase
VIAGARLSGAGFEGRRKGIPLVFVHGVGSTAAIWDYQLRAFKDRLCAAIELRGNGMQKPDPDPTTITRAGYAEDVLTVADALGIERFSLVGCSLGGVVAFELWRSAPERIGGMVILGSFARYPDGERYADQICTQAREIGDMRAFAELRAAKLGLPPERLRETLEQYGCKSVECFVAATQATWTGDYRDALSTVDVPVTVAYGEHDSIAPRALAEEIAGGITGANLTMISDAGHVANADNPNDFNRLLREFLE